MTTAIQINTLSKSFNQVDALKNISITIEEGEIVALIGPSGSGKSTLLRHIAGLETANKASNSDIQIFQQSIQSNGRLAKRARLIRAKIGVIFQQFNLVSRMNVLSNVLLGSLGSIPWWRGTLGIFTKQEKLLAYQSLDRVGLAELAYQRASTLSGGQQQRVAIARTLMQQANLILADEPIASLDPKSAKTVMKHLRSINKKDKKTVVITLHQVDYARKYCKRAIALVNGEIAFDGKSKDLTDSVLEELYGTSMSDTDDELELDSEVAPSISMDLLGVANG